MTKLTHVLGRATLKDWSLFVVDEIVKQLQTDELEKILLKAVAETWECLQEQNGMGVDMPMIYYPGDGADGQAPEDPLTIRVSFEIGDGDDRHGGCVYHHFSLSEMIEEEIANIRGSGFGEDGHELEGFHKIRDQLKALSEKLSEAIAKEEAT